MLFLDETIITETSPLRAARAPQGCQGRVPITGDRAKRILFGAFNQKSGSLTLTEALRWNQETFQQFLRQVRRHCRGWRIVLFLDRGSPHKAKRSQALARSLAIEQRWLPTACPEINPVEGLWRHLKQEVLTNTVTPVSQASAEAQEYLLTMPREERRSRSGVRSKNFWLDTGV